MQINYDYKFEIKPGRYVYIQSREARDRARVLLKRVRIKYKPNAIFYHLGEQGGHVEAMRIHHGNKYFSRYDIDDFFGHVTRTKVTRSLCNIGFRRDVAFDMAIESVVVEGPSKIVPFGFRQSPLLATLVLEHSGLGRHLVELAANRYLTVSIYMDDIVLSSNFREILEVASPPLEMIAQRSGFRLGRDKMTVAAVSVDVFNCRLADNEITILDDRMRKFFRDFREAGEAGKDAIIRYIEMVSPGAAEGFIAELG
jgi:Reverse transcriptase (RNA-dependent DNA polymerase)